MSNVITHCRIDRRVSIANRESYPADAKRRGTSGPLEVFREIGSVRYLSLSLFYFLPFVGRICLVLSFLGFPISFVCIRSEFVSEEVHSLKRIPTTRDDACWNAQKSVWPVRTSWPRGYVDSNIPVGRRARTPNICGEAKGGVLLLRQM